MSDAECDLDLPDGPLRDSYIRLNSVYVKTRRHGAALKTLESLLMASRHASSHQGFALLGESGAGKSRTLEYFEEWLRQRLQRAPDEPSPFPVVTLSADTTPKDLLEMLLAVHGDPLSKSGTRADLEKRLRKLIPNCPHILGICLDEVHHVFVGKTGRQKNTMAAILKNFVSVFPKPIVILGPLAVEDYLDASDGLAMRFEQREYLEDLRLDLDDDLYDLLAVLRALDVLLPSEPGWSPASPVMLKRLYLAGGGSFGRIVSMVRRACANGAIDGAAAVGASHFSASWRSIARRKVRQPAHDPFLMDIATVTRLAAQLNAKLTSDDERFANAMRPHGL